MRVARRKRKKECDCILYVFTLIYRHTRTQQPVMFSDFMFWNAVVPFEWLVEFSHFDVERGHTIAQNFKDFSIHLLFQCNNITRLSYFERPNDIITVCFVAHLFSLVGTVSPNVSMCVRTAFWHFWIIEVIYPLTMKSTQTFHLSFAAHLFACRHISTPTHKSGIAIAGANSVWECKNESKSGGRVCVCALVLVLGTFVPFFIIVYFFVFFYYNCYYSAMKASDNHLWVYDWR